MGPRRREILNATLGREGPRKQLSHGLTAEGVGQKHGRERVQPTDDAGSGRVAPLGHTFSLGRNTTAAGNSCLTMYPSGNYGGTQKRTLGAGDIIGIKKVYP